jgi:hypothetical protein
MESTGFENDLPDGEERDASRSVGLLAIISHDVAGSPIIFY